MQYRRSQLLFVRLLSCFVSCFSFLVVASWLMCSFHVGWKTAPKKWLEHIIKFVLFSSSFPLFSYLHEGEPPEAYILFTVHF